MYLAKIIGNIVATAKNENLTGIPLFVVQPVDEYLKDSGSAEVAIDSIGVGEGEFVWVEGGKEAAYALPGKYGPSDASIVGKIEHIDAAIRLDPNKPVPLPESGKVRSFS